MQCSSYLHTLMTRVTSVHRKILMWQSYNGPIEIGTALKHSNLHFTLNLQTSKSTIFKISDAQLNNFLTDKPREQCRTYDLLPSGSYPGSSLSSPRSMLRINRIPPWDLELLFCIVFCNILLHNILYSYGFCQFCVTVQNMTERQCHLVVG